MRDQVSFVYGHAFGEVTETGAKLISVKNKAEKEVACDSIIICRSYHGQPKRFEEIRKEIPETYLVGDAILKNRCDNKRVIHNAIEDAFGIANNI